MRFKLQAQSELGADFYMSCFQSIVEDVSACDFTLLCGKDINLYCNVIIIT